MFIVLKSSYDSLYEIYQSAINSKNELLKKNKGLEALVEKLRQENKNLTDQMMESSERLFKKLEGIEADKVRLSNRLDEAEKKLLQAKNAFQDLWSDK